MTTESPRLPYKPRKVSAPGETLLDLLEERGITQAELATRLDLTRKTVNGIVKGSEPISPTTALQLERALGVPADFWLTREAHYREHLARKVDEEQLAEYRPWLSELPIADMTRLGWIEAGRRPTDRIAASLRFFGVANVEAWREQYERPLVAWRSSAKVKRKVGAAAAWLRCAELDAAKIATGAWDEAAFTRTLRDLRALTHERDLSRVTHRLVDACAPHGVAVVLVPAPKGCPVSGATRWLAPGKGLLALTARHRTDDHFWFSFFHEAGHLVKHGKRMQFFEVEGELDGAEEGEANRFARDLLIPADARRELAALRGRDAIAAFATRHGIAPGIVVGRLQHDKVIGWHAHNDLKVRYAATERMGA